MPNQVAGFVGAIMAALLWGSFAVPIKLVDTGDGFVFQWVRPSLHLFDDLRYAMVQSINPRGF
jgi:ABC-type transport system involved in cytochrome c biogenesis permease subunit